MKPQVALSWSGGKDSALMLQALLAEGAYAPAALLTSVTRDYDRVSIHGVRRALLERQAAAVGLPLFTIALDAECSNAAYEAAFHTALRELRRELPAVRHVAFGDLFLEDVRAYRGRLLAGTDWRPLFPLWGRDTAALAEQFVRDRFEAHLVCVDTTQLDAAFCGRAFDRQLLADLPPAADPCGERGEFHTFVAAGPVFSRAVHHRVGERVRRDDRFVYCDLVPEEASEGAREAYLQSAAPGAAGTANDPSA